MTLREFRKLSPGDAVLWTDPKTGKKQKLVLKTFIVTETGQFRITGRDAAGEVRTQLCDPAELVAA